MFDAFQERLFALFLQAQGERHLDGVSRYRHLRRQLARHRQARGVDLHALDAGFSAQVAVVVVLDAFLADDGSLLNAMEGPHLELAFRHLAYVTEDLRAHFAERVGADRHGLLNDAGVFALTLGQHRQRARPGVGLDRHGRVGQDVPFVHHDVLDVAGAHAEQAAQPPVERESCMAFRRQRRGDDLHRIGCAAADDRLAFPIQDLPPWRGNGKVAYAVGVRLLNVLFAGKHLQVPEAEEDHAEHNHRHAADDRHAQRELRRDRQPRVAWPYPLERAHARESGLSPPVV